MAVVDSHGLGQQHHAALGCAVGCCLVATYQAPARRVVDDGPAPLSDHRRQREPGHQVRAFEADVHGQVPFLFGALQDSVGIKHTRIVEENVQTAKDLNRPVHSPATLLSRAHVTAGKDGHPTCSLDLGDHFLPPRFIAADDGDLGTLPAKEHRRGPADTRGPASDQRCLASQSTHTRAPSLADLLRRHLPHRPLVVACHHGEIAAQRFVDGWIAGVDP